MTKRKIEMKSKNNEITDIEKISNELTDDVGVKVVNELLTTVTDENIDIKTELSDIEIKLITKLKHIYKEFDITRGDDLLKTFMRLKLSKTRKSRKEIIEVAKAEAQHEIESSFGGRMKRMFTGQNQ